MQHKLIDAGQWTWAGEGVAWELYRSSSLPKPEDCTAAFCVAFNAEAKIVLEREERGWGMLGGHIDGNESIEQALARECLEEGGYTVAGPVLFGYRKIIATSPVRHPAPGKAYPFPVSYIAYYYATSSAELLEPTELEVLEVKAFSLEEIDALSIPTFQPSN